MRVILTEEEVIEATILQLKSKGTLALDVEYSAKIEPYSSRQYFTISETEAKEDVA